MRGGDAGGGGGGGEVYYLLQLLLLEEETWRKRTNTMFGLQVSSYHCSDSSSFRHSVCCMVISGYAGVSPTKLGEGVEVLMLSPGWFVVNSAENVLE